MHTNPNKLGYNESIVSSTEQSHSNPPIRLKSVSKNQSLSKLISSNKKSQKSTLKQLNYDYLLFVFLNSKENEEVRYYLECLKKSQFLHQSNIIFFSSIKSFLNIFKQVLYSTCHKRFALIIGENGILNHKRTFNQIDEIHVILNRQEQYSKIRHLLEEKNVMSIIYDMEHADNLLIDINVLRKSNQKQIMPSLVCRQKFNQRKQLNEENKQNTYEKYIKSQAPAQSDIILPAYSKKQFQNSHPDYEKQQNITNQKIKSHKKIKYIVRNKQKSMELPYESTLKMEQQNPIRIQINKKNIFSQYYSNVEQLQQNPQSSYELQIRNIALQQKRKQSQFNKTNEGSVKGCRKKDAQLWYKRYASSKDKGLQKRVDKIIQHSSTGFRLMSQDPCSNSSSSNSGSKWYSQYRKGNTSNLSNFKTLLNERNSQSKISVQDEYELTNYLWK